MNKIVAVLGASKKEDRYSNKAVLKLIKEGYETIPINPTGCEIHGIKSVANLADIECDIDILTMYVNASRSAKLADDIIDLRPRKIIFNPGAENAELAKLCEKNNIETEDACTLILLNMGEF